MTEHRAATGRALPGELVAEYAKKCGWPLLRYNIVVEGTSDRRYIKLASRLYRNSVGKNALADDVSVFPIGSAGDGGCYGIMREFPTLRQIIDRDLNADGGRVYTAIALFDYDRAGREAVANLSKTHMRYVEYRDLFLLRRRLPVGTRDTNRLRAETVQLNAQFGELDCTIEDMLSVDIIESFMTAHPLYRVAPVVAGGATHFPFDFRAKRELLKFVEQNATLGDVSALLGLIQSLEFYSGKTGPS